MFAVLSSINSQVKGYVYSDGYLRTSCKEFSLDNLSSRFVHLTNDAIQQTSDEYGRFESGNKISFQQFQRYLDHAFPDKKINVNKDLMPQITRLVTDSFYATFSKIDPLRRQNSFEIFGYDFMIDSDFKVYIIECNTNPCLELSCPLMARIIPAMLDNVFRVVVDPLFPPPDFSMAKKNLMHDILPISKLELVFDERLSGNHCRELSGDDPKLNLRI
jgi:tubulin monoglycylase TTLL3/8